MATLASVSPAEVHNFQAMMVQEATRDLGELWSLIDDPMNTQLVKDVIYQYYPTLVNTYGESVAVLAAEQFETIRRTANANGRFTALLAPQLDNKFIGYRIFDALEPLFRGDLSNPDEVFRNLEGLTSRLVLDQGRRTTEANTFTKGSGANGFVRVPSRIDTCQFCLMLASKTYKSAKTAGEGRDFHERCNCAVMPHFEAIVIEGYDQEGYLEQYKKLQYGEEPVSE